MMGSNNKLVVLNDRVAQVCEELYDVKVRSGYELPDLRQESSGLRAPFCMQGEQMSNQIKEACLSLHTKAMGILHGTESGRSTPTPTSPPRPKGLPPTPKLIRRRLFED